MTKDEEITYLKMQLKLYRHDYLTGLKGRRDFEYDVRHKFAKMDFWLAMHDIDGLKKANDSGGHEMGDVLLKQVANDLQMCQAPCEVYRTGGDEFMTIYCKQPDSVEVPNTTSAVLCSCDFGSVGDLINAVDQIVNRCKVLAGKRRKDDL